MRQSNRLVLNFVATLARMLINIGLGLLATRLLLTYLGKVDYGLLIAIGAAVGLLTVAANTVRISASREIGLEIGKANAASVSQVFNTTFVIYLILATCTLVLAFAIAPLVLGLLDIPADRAGTAHWVYVLTALNLILLVGFLPFEIMLMAKQEIVVTSSFQVLEALLKLAAAGILLQVESDRLMVYACALSLIMLGLHLARAIACLRRVSEARLAFGHYRTEHAWKILGFSRWSLLHVLSQYLRQDACLLLINIFFGAALNALYAIGQQISVYLQNFAQALENIVFPASMNLQGAGSSRNSSLVAFWGEKYTLLMLSVLVVPMFLEAPALIKLWLGEAVYDPQIILFAKPLIVWTMIGLLGRSYTVLLIGHGNYRLYSILQCLLALLVLLAGWLSFRIFKLDATILPHLMIAGALLLLLARLLYISQVVDIPWASWREHVLGPCLSVLLLSSAGALGVQYLLEPSLLRVLTVAVVYAIIAAPAIWLLGLGDAEREHYQRLLAGILSR